MKQKQKELIEMEDEVIDEASDGIKLSQKSLEVDIINSVMFQDYHMALLPLVYMHQAKQRLKKEKVNKIATELVKNTFKIDLASIFDKKKQVVLGREMMLETAYTLLVDSDPKCDLEIRTKQFILANLPEEFKEDCGRKLESKIIEKSGENTSKDAFLFLENKGARTNKLEFNDDNAKTAIEAVDKTLV